MNVDHFKGFYFYDIQAKYFSIQSYFVILTLTRDEIYFSIIQWVSSGVFVKWSGIPLSLITNTGS